MNKLNTLTKLSEKVSVYVPSTIDVDKAINNELFVGLIQAELSKLFGGSTALDVTGTWISNEHGLIEEDVTIVYAFTDCLTNESIDKVIGLCEMLKNALKQECISLEVNGVLYFV